MPELYSAFRQHLETNRSARTARTYATVAAAAVAFFAARGVSSAPNTKDIDAFLARPSRTGRGRAPATRNQELAALRALGAFAVARGHWRANPTTGIEFAREAPRDPAVLSAIELRRFFVVAAQQTQPRRRAIDIAIIALLSQAGLRVHELVALDVEQVDGASATLVAVRGKGGTVHDVPLNAPTIALLNAWIAESKPVAMGDHRPLFVSSRGARLSIRSVQRLLARLRAEVGTKKRVTPHTLRHTTATLALVMGSDLSTVGDLLRHSDLNTTRRYLHLVDERRRDAVNRLATAIPAEVMAVPAADARSNPKVASCAQRSAKSATGCDGGVDVQYGLNDAA